MTEEAPDTTALTPDLTQLLRTLEQVMELANRTDRRPQHERLSAAVTGHLGEQWATLPEEAFRFSSVRGDEVWAALQAVIESDEGESPVVQGLGDEHLGGVGSLRSLVHQDIAFPNYHLVGPTFTTLTFPDASTVRTPVVALVLLEREGEPQAVLFSPSPDGGQGVLTVLGQGAEATIAAVHEALGAASLFQGQVVELHLDLTEMHDMRTSLTVLPRPEVTADQIVLPDGLLDRITGHVHGIHDAVDALRGAGQHLRRGVLLYGPPGTGKTLVIRHLMARQDVTVVVLRSLEHGQMRAAMDLARTAQPSLLVVEDTDLLLSAGPESFELHALLEELDGLGGDADIAVVLTTNDPAALLPSLNHRPGRIDLQVEVPLPDGEGRERLFALYGAPLELPSVDLLAAAEATDGASGAWIREVVRREVLAADREQRAPSGEGLLACIAGMRQDDEAVLASAGGGDDDGFAEDEDLDDYR